MEKPIVLKGKKSAEKLANHWSITARIRSQPQVFHKTDWGLTVIITSQGSKTHSSKLHNFPDDQ